VTAPAIAPPSSHLVGANLEIEKLYAAYDQQVALHGVSISVPAGACVAVLGANGAGKTTLLNSIAGLHRPVRGSIRLSDDSIDGWTAHHIARSGVCYVPEGRGVFPDLTVMENLRLSVHSSCIDQVFTCFPALQRLGRRSAGSLSGGEQQMLAMAPAVVGSYRLLLVDELSLGLAPVIVDRLFELLDQIRGRGSSIVLVEQFAERALALADHAYVIRKGVVVYEGPAAHLRGRSDLLHALYLGEQS
jgi:branched-chain amino acid transport system ATP-binding protein